MSGRVLPKHLEKLPLPLAWWEYIAALHDELDRSTARERKLVESSPCTEAETPVSKRDPRTS